MPITLSTFSPTTESVNARLGDQFDNITQSKIGRHSHNLRSGNHDVTHLHAGTACAFDDAECISVQNLILLCVAQ